MGFKNFGVFLLLLSVQLHPLLALRQKTLANPFIATEGSLMSAKLGDDKPNITAVNRLPRFEFGFGGSRGEGGNGGSPGGSSGFGGSSGAESSTSAAKSHPAAAGAAAVTTTGTAAGVTGVVAHGSNGAYLNYDSLSHITLALLAYCFLLRF